MESNNKPNPFAGTWRLLSWENKGPDGTITYPYGKEPAGILIYTENGFMSAQIMNPDRGQSDPGFPAEPAFRQTLPDRDRIMAYNTQVSYCGPYDFFPEEKKMIHHVWIGAIPAWSGKDQVREFEFADGKLILGGRNSKLVWERMDDHV